MSVTDDFRSARDRLLAMRTDYGRAREEFSWPRFEHFNFALDWFDQIAANPATANNPALVIVEQDGSATRRTFAQLSDDSNRLANWLRSVGVRRGDHMILMLGNQVELWEFMLAGIKLGIVLIPTTTLMGPADLRDRVERGKAAWAVAGSANIAKFADVPGSYRLIEVADQPSATAQTEAHDGGTPAGAETLQYGDSRDASAVFEPDAPTGADDTLLLYFTSGTTSKAKLVEHTHTSYPVGHLSTLYWIGIEPGDVHLNVASPGWAKHAWSNVFTPWIAEACVFVYNYDRFDARALMEQMDREGVTSFCAPPTVWRMLIQADLTVLKNPPTKVVSAGEPLNAEVIDQVSRAWGQTIRDGFGQTETTVQVANTPGQPVTVGAMGKPLPGYDVVLVDPVTGQEGDDGELCLRLDPRPAGLMKAYYGDPGRTAEAFRDGYYHTGDMASRDADGVITYIGRDDDVFKSSDYRLSPFELESVLIEHPAVAEAAVVPSPDELRLSVPKAFVVLVAGTEPSAEVAEDIFRYCRDHLAPFKRIRRLEFGALPKTISGKIRRVELRTSEALRHTAGGGAASPGAAGIAQIAGAGVGVEYSESDFPGLRNGA
ncbi:AMP-binding protein [Pseudarthrobacter sp. J75]|uniref:AMP-binding protein n=1 Tax=unclassified Pseudarthrobacter TaxID=2647000 RepID=UPI002E810A11|nr:MULTISPECIES: AMP-binding protein [unclassified Pseudarthrobacter]MEE2523465.1 AMP-binding protein [Pseudarthrobacter sp. J47]MEE2530440.1 AMP-binding protein [Pseudarthrobacter sp. J75]MEE2570152.1 AMP-binding protein [Pseudarthrobacter sp. J64]